MFDIGGASAIELKVRAEQMRRWLETSSAPPLNGTLYRLVVVVVEEEEEQGRIDAAGLRFGAAELRQGAG